MSAIYAGCLLSMGMPAPSSKSSIKWFHIETNTKPHISIVTNSDHDRLSLLPVMSVNTSVSYRQQKRWGEHGKNASIVKGSGGEGSNTGPNIYNDQRQGLISSVCDCRTLEEKVNGSKLALNLLQSSIE